MVTEFGNLYENPPARLVIKCKGHWETSEMTSNRKRFPPGGEAYELLIDTMPTILAI